MLSTYEFPEYSYCRSPDQDAAEPVHHAVIVVGAGPVGLAAGLDCALQGIDALVLDDNNTVSVGSRAVCYAKRALEVLDRLGCGQRMVDKGVTWNVGKVFFKERKVYEFDLLPEKSQHRPGMINLQQYYLEEYMVDRAGEVDGLDLRWKNRVTAVEHSPERVIVTVQTPDGAYRMSCDYLIAADGANSDLRAMLRLESRGQIFEDRFLIADVVMKADFPPERWFWFDPPFHPNQSTLLHRQADDVWRIDFQLGWDADPEEESRPENVLPRVRAMLGDEREFALEWCSVYTFTCRRMDSFRHGDGRVLFVGDAAHQVSPFGARGANSGIQDSDNLAWKLRLVLDGRAPDSLLDSYSEERVFAAAENLLNSTRSTDFITPKSAISRAFRDATLLLSERYPFARSLVNSGRLSVPAVLSESSLNTPDEDEFCGDMVPGAPSYDAPIAVDGEPGWLLDRLGFAFKALYFADGPAGVGDAALAAMAGLARGDIPIETLIVSAAPVAGGELPDGVSAIEDVDGLLRQRFDARPGSTYLLRPDQHVCARWRALDAGKLAAALARATGQSADG